MDKEEQDRELQNLALADYTGRCGNIYQATAEHDRQNTINEDNRKNKQAFLLQYQQLVDDIDSLLTDTETQLYETIQAYEKRLAQELQKASRTEDGRIVFKDKDGNIHAYDRQPLSEEEILSVRWKPDSCDWETVQYIGENLQKLRAMNDRVFDMRNRFDDIKDDPTPKNLKELEGFEDELKKMGKAIDALQNSIQRENQIQDGLKLNSDAIIPNIPLNKNQL